MTVQPRDDLALIEGYHSPQVKVDVRLNTNESPLAPPPEWQSELGARLASVEWNRYPDREALDLRTEIGALHGLGPENVFVANGSNEVLQTLLLAYGGHDRKALVFEPTYALHSHIARLTGTEVVVAQRNDDFSLGVNDVLSVVREANPAITFLCSPNNPTGMLEDDDLVNGLPGLVSGLVVVDEAYGQFAPRSAVRNVNDDLSSNLVVTRTFSKTWSMAAARLGYCIAPREIVAELNKVVLPYHLDAFKQLAGSLALGYVDQMEKRVAVIVEERGRLTAALNELPVDLWPSSANFVLFRPRAIDGAEVWQLLVDRSILVRNCSSWPRLTGCLRVTIGTREEDDAFLSALQEILS